MSALNDSPRSDARLLLDPDEVAAAQRQIAAAVLALQSVHFDGFGELDRCGEPDGLNTLVDALRNRADLRVADEDARELFSRLLDRESGLFAGGQQPALCHDDLHHGNVLFRRGGGRWQLAGLLDWDKAWSGPAESDVARMAFWDNMTGPGFWEVYRGAVPATAGEAERALVYQLLWCLE